MCQHCGHYQTPSVLICLFLNADSQSDRHISQTSMWKKSGQEAGTSMFFIHSVSCKRRTPISNTQPWAELFGFSVFLFCSAGPNNYQPEFMAATSSCKSLSSHRQGSHRLMRFGPHSALNFPRSGPNLNCNFMTLVLVVVWASWPGPKGEIAGATGTQNFLRQHGSSIFCAFRGSRCCGFCDAASLAATNWSIPLIDELLSATKSL